MAYTYDDDGNATSMVGGGAAQYFTFDSANQLVCVGEVPGGCERNRIRYDVHGRRIMDLKGPATYDVYVGDDFGYRRLPTALLAEVEVRALGTGLLLLDETGARIRHTQLTPFGRTYTLQSLSRYRRGRLSAQLDLTALLGGSATHPAV